MSASPGDAARPRGGGLLAWVGPGLLVAATGVGAGDLATAGFAGSRFGVTVAWAVLLGAWLKFILNENLARWQAGTGETVLEAMLRRFPRPVYAAFGAYLVFWSFFVGAALVSACGVIGRELVASLAGGPPFGLDADAAKLALGIACSLAGAGIALAGGFRWFERIMATAIAIMFATVVGAAALLVAKDGDSAARLAELAAGLAVPRIPAGDGGLGWTVALMGGVGGTLTILCYAYWMRDGGRTGPEHLGPIRRDLAVAYAGTAVFGVAMLVIAAGIAPEGVVDGRGAALVAGLADRMTEAGGPLAARLFLVGAFAAVFSSLVGVWQGVPLVFADWWGCRRHAGAGPPPAPVGASSPPAAGSAPARWFLAWLVVGSLPGLWMTFGTVQKAYGVVGALFIPLLAAGLLVLNRRDPALPRPLRNGPVRTALLACAVAVLGVAAAFDVARRLGLP